MDFKNRIKYAINSVSVDKSTTRFNVMKSIVSLLLISLIIITTAMCWYFDPQATIESGNINLDAGNGIKITSSLDKDGVIYVKDSSKLIPASSVDGQNIYFPVDGSFSDKTTEMTFRKGNAGDANVNYLKVDFAISADADNTYVYLDDEHSYIKINGISDEEEARKGASPIRAAICCDEQSNAVVLNPYKETTVQAVQKADRATGFVLLTNSQFSYDFADYSFSSSRPVVKLNAGETKEFSLVIWLEGTDPSCTYDYISGKSLDIDIQFTTSWEESQTIHFRDSTTDKWLTDYISDSNATLQLVYDNVESETMETSSFKMYRAGDVWTTKIPSNAHKDVYFQIVDGSGDVIYTFDKDKKGTSTKNRKDYTIYYAEGSEGSQYGHWIDKVESGGIGKDDQDIDGDDW